MPLVSLAAGRQFALAPIDLLPNAPTTYQMRDWHKTATDFDTLAFNTTATGQFLPLVRIDNTLQPPQTQTWFGLPAYVGETRTFGETGEPIHEAIASLGAVLGGTLVGVDKTTGPYNWVAMSREYYVDRNSQFVVLNTPFSVSGQSAWYETYPSILFYSIADRYPGEAISANRSQHVDARFYSAVNKLTAGGTAPNFNYTAYNFTHRTACVQRHVARARHGIGNGLVAACGLLAESRVESDTGGRTSKRGRLELGVLRTDVEQPRLRDTNAVRRLRRRPHERRARPQLQHSEVGGLGLRRSNARPTKIMISGEQWGGEDVGGLMGFTIPNTGNPTSAAMRSR